MNDFHIYPWAFVVKHMWEDKRKIQMTLTLT